MGDKLNKSQSVLHRIKVLDVVQDELPWAMFERTDVGMGDMQRTVNVEYDVWVDMGRPDVITVTIEPGDLLNEEE